MIEKGCDMKTAFPFLLLAACSDHSSPPVRQGSTEATETLQSRAAIPGATAARPGIPSPAEAAKMGRVYLADGSFIHGDHIHKAGQEKCPTEMNGGPVQ